MKEWLKRHWPKLRLRTLLFGIFLFVAGLPGLSAVFLRVYENTLVRQTESELIVQGAAFAAMAGGRFAPAERPSPQSERITSSDLRRLSYDDASSGYYLPETPRIDLSETEILPERPEPQPASPPFDQKAKALGAQLEPVIEQTGRTTLASIILLDSRGVATTGAWRGQSFAHIREVAAALQGRTSTTLRYNDAYQQRYAFEWLTRAAAVRVHHARPILINGQPNGVVLLSRSSRALFRGVYQDRGKILLGVALIFSILVLLTLLLHRTIAKPIEALSAATRGLGEGRGVIPDPPPTAAIEIQNLHADFAAMSEAIARRSRYLRDFASALAHEFKTPLAGIRGAIELIEDHQDSMTDAERARFLGNMTGDTDRLAALVSRLLDLARADMAQPEAGVFVDLPALLHCVADAMRGAAFDVQLEIGKALPKAAISGEALETVLIGLLDNSRQAGASRAILAASRTGEDVGIELGDDGPGIAPADRDRLFEPFFTTRRETGGTGLGLSISRSLIEAHGGTIDLGEGAKGATFRILLKTRA